MSLNYSTEEAIRNLCRELPEAIDKLAAASKRREPLIIMVPSDVTPEQLKAFGEVLRKALAE